MVALGAARFPHGSHIYFDDFPIEIPMELSPAPSWSGTSTLGQNTSASPRSDAPFGCPRVGLESDNFGAEKKASCKKNG